MDNLVGFKTRLDPKPKRTAAEAVELIKDVFVTAGERDIYTGDAVEICVITATGSETQVNTAYYTLHCTVLHCTCTYIYIYIYICCMYK
jgi:20S proteasome alpha/beta subunit